MTENTQAGEQAAQDKPGKIIYGTLRMAKASQADLDTAYRLMRLLDDIGRGYYPINAEDDDEYLRFLHRQICEIADNSGGVSRVIGAAGILLNPKNNLIDPDDDCIELHPDLKAGNAAEEEVEALRARVAELEALCSELYQVAGALGAPVAVLDALHAAASSEPLPGEPLNGLNIANDIDRAGQEKLEPVFAFRRKGVVDFCTCVEERYNELAKMPDIFEVRVFYAARPVLRANGFKVES